MIIEVALGVFLGLYFFTIFFFLGLIMITYNSCEDISGKIGVVFLSLLQIPFAPLIIGMMYFESVLGDKN